MVVNKREIAVKKAFGTTLEQGDLKSGVSLAENRRGKGLRGSGFLKMCFCVCGGCLVMEEGVVGVGGAERETDCRYGGRGEERSKR